MKSELHPLQSHKSVLTSTEKMHWTKDLMKRRESWQLLEWNILKKARIYISVHDFWEAESFQNLCTAVPQSSFSDVRHMFYLNLFTLMDKLSCKMIREMTYFCSAVIDPCFVLYFLKLNWCIIIIITASNSNNFTIIS